MIKKIFLLLILALGVGLALPSTRPKLVNPVRDRIQTRLVPERLEAIAGQLQQRLRRGEPLPQGDWGRWIESYTTSSSIDPWGHIYYLQRLRDGFTVGSMGPDGKQGTADDLTITRQAP